MSLGPVYPLGVERARATWTDERLDDLSHRMDLGFRDLRAEMKSEIRDLRAENQAQFAALNRTILQIGGGMFMTFVVGFVGLLAAQS